MGNISVFRRGVTLEILKVNIFSPIREIEGERERDMQSEGYREDGNGGEGAR